ncbi:unnamed protein product [Dibothriocephalus latus]|uniref:Uncharacterized protein n=1 Tax=Dibothriocephalus latus TaxID=60516 RepID=A0A3P7N8M9_DIBLA|nr:unnamed protein product [Dibothriocephalus latus]
MVKENAPGTANVSIDGSSLSHQQQHLLEEEDSVRSPKDELVTDEPPVGNVSEGCETQKDGQSKFIADLAEAGREGETLETKPQEKGEEQTQDVKEDQGSTSSIAKDQADEAKDVNMVDVDDVPVVTLEVSPTDGKDDVAGETDDFPAPESSNTDDQKAASDQSDEPGSSLSNLKIFTQIHFNKCFKQQQTARDYIAPIRTFPSSTPG